MQQVADKHLKHHLEVNTQEPAAPQEKIETVVSQAVSNYLDNLRGFTSDLDLHRLVTGSAEKALICTVLKRVKNQSEAAKQLGISRITLRKKIERYQILP